MAFLFGPDGQEVGRQAKIHLARGERGILGYKVIPKEQEYWVFNTNYGKVGLAVCYDIFFTDVVRNLAKNGAQIVLVPVNADFDSTPNFPIFFTVEAIFRAVENNVAIGISTTSGISTIINPYGKISAMSDINRREVIAGEVFIREQ
jgi:apolipoprotein N-acyltransferase